MTKKRDVARLAKKIAAATGLHVVEAKKHAKAYVSFDFYKEDKNGDLLLDVVRSPHYCDLPGCTVVDRVSVRGPKGEYVCFEG